MYKPRAKKVCKLCKLDLTPWGEDRRTLCPDCVRSINETMVKCAGKCKKERPIKLMERVSLYFEPGKKGGKKFSVYYCQQCFLSAKSRARQIEELQLLAVKKTESRRSRASTK